jgi:hypothetical protein
LALRFRGNGDRAQQGAIWIELERGAPNHLTVLTRDDRRRKMIQEAVERKVIPFQEPKYL